VDLRSEAPLEKARNRGLKGRREEHSVKHWKTSQVAGKVALSICVEMCWGVKCGAWRGAKKKKTKISNGKKNEKGNVGGGGRGAWQWSSNDVTLRKEAHVKSLCPRKKERRGSQRGGDRAK